MKSKFGRGSTFMFSVLLGRDDNYTDKTKKDVSMGPVSTMSLKQPVSTMSMRGMPMSTLSIAKVDTKRLQSSMNEKISSKSHSS